MTNSLWSIGVRLGRSERRVGCAAFAAAACIGRMLAVLYLTA